MLVDSERAARAGAGLSATPAIADCEVALRAQIGWRPIQRVSDESTRSASGLAGSRASTWRYACTAAGI
jgi:hypothetical protein